MAKVEVIENIPLLNKEQIIQSSGSSKQFVWGSSLKRELAEKELEKSECYSAQTRMSFFKALKKKEEAAEGTITGEL